MGGLRPCSLRAARPSLGAPARLPPLATSPPDGSISCRSPGRGRPAFAEVPYPFRGSLESWDVQRFKELPPRPGFVISPPRWEVQLTHTLALLAKSLWTSVRESKTQHYTGDHLARGS